MGDAIIRTLFRLFVTRRHLLEWVTAAQATIGPRLDLSGFYRRMAGAPVIGGWRADRRWIAGQARGRWRRHSPRSGSRRRPWRAGSACRRGSPAGIAVSASRRPGLAADRAPDLALLRDLRDRGRPHAAAGQFPGGPPAGARPSDLADQSRPLSAVGGHAPATSAGPGSTEAVERLEATLATMGGLRAFPRPFLQLVRHAGSAAARSAAMSPRSTAATWPGT